LGIFESDIDRAVVKHYALAAYQELGTGLAGRRLVVELALVDVERGGKGIWFEMRCVLSVGRQCAA
jgi:hypothetical protein